MFVVYCCLYSQLCRRGVPDLVETVQGKYERRKEGVSEEMEVEAGKLEQDVEEDFGPGRFAR